MTEQALVPVGIVEFSTGDTFVIDDEHCDAASFKNHTTSSRPSGPKTGPSPANDAPEGAIALTSGLAAQHDERRSDTGGRGPDPDLSRGHLRPLRPDPVVHDRRHRGTGHDRHGGKQFDTLIGVYDPTDAGFEEIACIDDVEFEPVGSTYQAALTFDTEEGVTYYVQIGGYFFPFDDPVAAEKGRIRIRVR